MPLMGVQAVLTDEAWADESKQALARRMATEALTRVGVPVDGITFESERRYHSPAHVGKGCEYAAFDAANPGADADEFPWCEDDSHWLKGGYFHELNGYGEAPDA